MLVISPCKDCDERTPAGLCHSTCERYKKFVKQCEEIREARAKFKKVYDIPPSCVKWQTSEIKRKQRGRK